VSVASYEGTCQDRAIARSQT